MKFLSQLWFPVDPLQQKSFAFIQNIPGSASKCWSPLAAHIWNVTARFLRCVCVCVCVCGSLMPQSVFFFVGYFCPAAQSGPVVFGTLMKRDEDKKTWLFPIWRHCLCHWAFKVFYQQTAKWLCEICCAGFTELALGEVYSSQDVWLRGVELPPFAVYFLFKMKEAHWCGSHWAFSHRGVISCFTSISLSLKPVDFEVWH